MRLLYIIILAGIGFQFQAQSLTLISGKKTKVIEPGQWIEVATVDPAKMSDDDCHCPAWAGRFIEFNDTGLKLQVHGKSTIEPTGDTSRVMRAQTFLGEEASFPIESIVADDISSIVLKGRGKQMRGETTVETIGMLLTIAGIGALASTPIVEERGKLAVVGLAEICLGLIVVASSKQKRLYLSDHIEEENERIWKIVPN